MTPAHIRETTGFQGRRWTGAGKTMEAWLLEDGVEANGPVDKQPHKKVQDAVVGHWRPGKGAARDR